MYEGDFNDFMAIGDLHFKGGPDNVRRSNLLCEEIIKLVKTRRPDFIVLLGDTLHTFNKMYATIHGRACSFINELSTYTDKIYLLIGNHDIPNNKCYPPKDHGFEAYKISDKVVVVDEPVEFSYKGQDYLAVPYFPTGRFNEILEEYELSKYQIVFAHQEFKGIRLSKNRVSTTGDYIPESCNLVVTGHIHDYEFLKDKILNVGTPMQVNADETTDKAVVLFKAVSDDNPTLEWERVGLDIPVKHNIKIEYRKLSTIDPKLLTRDTKVVVICKPHHIPRLKNNKYYLNIKEKVYSVSHKTVGKEKKIKTTEKIVRFGDYFKSNLPKDLEYLYGELFEG
uniref:Calcineurin-like phosphoesterase domain-containing protein n=1 Tax=viral metagenome TaxID=1070528 RepID=A0A6C0JY84_9ZZZZ